MLEHILSHEECDVDPINRLEGATPLHLALQLKDPELRKHIIESLLEAGADTQYVLCPVGVLTTCTERYTYRIKDKNGETVMDLLSPSDVEILQSIRKAQAQASVSLEDVASGTLPPFSG